MFQLSASLQCLDFTRMQEQIQVLNRCMDRYHVDVFDGHAVPNLVFGPEFISAVADLLTLPFDVHLAVEKPETLLEPFLESKADSLCLHIETVSHQFYRLADRIRAAGKKVGVVLNPLTGLESLPYIDEEIDRITVMTVDPGFAGQRFITPMLKKIRLLAEYKREHGSRFLIETDGSVNFTTFKDLFEHGNEVFILGSSGLFSVDADLERAAARVREYFVKLEKEGRAG
jgi:D-allulose-6-phosphate 3-epimerase